MQIMPQNQNDSRDTGQSGIEIRRIPGFPPYEVSENGDVYRRLDDGSLRRLRPTPCSGGYPSVQLGRAARRRVHVLVALAFIGERPNGYVVCHNDGVKTNCHYTNLRYDTVRGNHHDKVRHGTYLCGSQSHHAKLNETDVKVIRLLATSKESRDRLADFYRVAPCTIKDAVNRLTWKHVA